MKVLHRYILKEIFVPTILGLFFFTFVLLINKLFRMIEFLMNKNVDLSLITGLLSCLAPFFLSFTLPMGLLAGVLIAYGRLAADNEILAMKTNGVSLLSIYIPTIISSILLSAFLIAADFDYKPRLLQKASEIIYEMQFKVLTSIEPGKFYGDLTGGDIDLTLYCGDKNQQTGELKNINIKLSSSLGQIQEAANKKKKLEDVQKIKDGGAQLEKIRKQSDDLKKKYKNEQKEVLLIASSGIVEGDVKDDAIRLKLNKGSIHLLSRNNDYQNTMIFFQEVEKIMQPKFGTISGGSYMRPRKRMSMPELSVAYKALKPTKKEARLILIEYHQRISYPLACIAFTLIAMPLGVFIRPSGKSYGFVIAFALIFVYYLFQNWGEALMENGDRFAVLAMYSPNIILGIVGLILMVISLRK